MIRQFTSLRNATLITLSILTASTSASLAADDVAKTKAMTSAIVKKLPKLTGLKVEDFIGGTNYCRDDGYCSLNIGPVQASIYGRGVANVLTSSQIAPSKYRKICAGVYSAISGTAQGFADEIIQEAFQLAAAGNRVKFEMRGVEVTIRPDSDNLLGCRFFKY